MATFDAEVHLRRLGERTLLDREHFQPFGGPVAEQARVLTAVGAMDAEIAQRVVDDYARAVAVRSMDSAMHLRLARAPAAPDAPEPARRRVIPCDRTMVESWGELHIRYLSLSDTDTQLAVTARFAPASSPAQHSRSRYRHGHPGPFATIGPPPLTVTDDRGTIGTGGFSGGGSNEEWRGHYDIHPTLAPDTEWVELLGERLDLGPAAEDRAVTVQTFTDTDPAAVVDRCLDHCLAGSGHHAGTPSIDHAIEALTSAGLLEPDDPRIAETLGIHAALTGDGAPGGPVPRVREPWRSLLAHRGRATGPEGRLMIGAVTPVFDRISAALLELESEPYGFHCDFDLTGPVSMGMHTADDVTAVTIRYAATDDRGNHYLGHPGSWSGGNGKSEGTLDFWPALDPRARRLDLILTTDHARATITVPLTWTAR